MPSLYADYVRLYLLMDYSRDDSEFYARILCDLWDNADKEIPEKEDATIPEPEALDEQCRIALEPMLQSMAQNVSDEEDDTWGNWTAQGKLQQNRIAKRIQFLLNRGYKCFSQACCQAKSMTVSKKLLTNIELDKIKAECKDECCNPAGSSASATSSAILRWINAPISEAATEHSEIRRLLNLANENSKSSEAATEHSEIPEAACQEAKRPRKSGKGNFSQTQTMLFPGTNAKTITQACEH